ncbi:MAG: hypothetical protein QXU13_06600 [Desulfurococcaceae archaeon]
MSSKDILRDLWGCDCWFCRLFVLRLLRIIVRFEPRGVYQGGVAVSQGEVDLVKELKELKTTVEDLKRAIVEIKATLADLTGPFSAYRPLEETEKRVITTQAITAQPARAPIQSEKPSEAVEAGPVHPSEKPEVSEGKELTRVLTGISEVLQKERARITRAGLEKVLNTMRTLYELRRLYPRTSIETIVKMFEEMKLLTSEEVGLLRAAISLVEESLKENISHEENVLMMFMLLRQLGVRSEELEEEVLKTILDVLALKRRKQGGEASIIGMNSNGEEGKNEWVNQPQ